MATIRIRRVRDWLVRAADPDAPVMGEFGLDEIRRIGERACERQQWDYAVDFHKVELRQHDKVYEQINACFVVAAPDGRVAAWYSSERHRPDVAATKVTPATAATIATCDWVIGEVFAPAQQRRGARTLLPLAQATARVLHARTWQVPPDERDRLLEQFARCRAAHRPDTTLLLTASTDVLTAAAALLDAGVPVAARDLLKAARPKMPRKPRRGAA